MLSVPLKVSVVGAGGRVVVVVVVDVVVVDVDVVVVDVLDVVVDDVVVVVVPGWPTTTPPPNWAM